MERSLAMDRSTLAGQTAVVTGGSSGIGAAIAAELGRAGASVVVNYRSSEKGARDVVSTIEKAGGRAVAVGADVSQEDDVRHLFDEACKAYGAVDILIANAGLQRDAPTHEMSLDDWRAVIEVNLTGQFLCCREALRHFLDRGPRPEVSRALGKIVCISSVHQFIPWAGRVNYAASKGGVMLLMKSLAQEYADRKIRVNGIAPGAIKTAINKDSWEKEDARRDLLEKIPYDRIGDPEDVARAALWLVSDDSDYVTGETLVIDGGMALYPGFRNGG
jgi:glucose 1-dehydrogenase